MKTGTTAFIGGFFILLFTYTAIMKLHDHTNFLRQLSNWKYLSRAAVFLSWAIPLVELGIVGLLVFPATKRAGLCASLVLLSLFTIYLSGVVGSSAHVPCTCGGVLRQLSWKQHIVFNMACIVLSVVALYLSYISSTNKKGMPKTFTTE